MNSLPEAETPVYYVCTKAEEVLNTKYSEISTGYGYYIQLFYDFEIEGIKGRFISPSVENDDTAENLEKKGYIFSLGGSSDSYKVTAENRKKKLYLRKKHLYINNGFQHLFSKLDRGNNHRRRIQHSHFGGLLA